jgi:hypothetical protein
MSPTTRLGLHPVEPSVERYGEGPDIVSKYDKIDERVRDLENWRNKEEGARSERQSWEKRHSDLRAFCAAIIGVETTIIVTLIVAVIYH